MKTLKTHYHEKRKRLIFIESNSDHRNISPVFNLYLKTTNYGVCKMRTKNYRNKLPF
jgi:hypothetical protein